MSSREGISQLIAQLEQQPSRLAEVKLRARRQGSIEDERLEEQITAQLQDIEKRINDLRASLE